MEKFHIGVDWKAWSVFVTIVLLIFGKCCYMACQDEQREEAEAEDRRRRRRRKKLRFMSMKEYLETDENVNPTHIIILKDK